MNPSRVACRPGAKRRSWIGLVWSWRCSQRQLAPSRRRPSTTRASAAASRIRKVLRLPGRRSRRVRPKPISLAPPLPTLKGASGSPIFRLGPYEINVRSQGFSDATRRLNLTVGSAFDLPIALKLEARSGERYRHRDRHSARIGAQPDRRDGLTDRSRPRCRSTGGTSSTSPSWCLASRRQTSAARNCSRKRQPSRELVCRSAASEISRTTSSSTACRPTTMRRASAACPTVSTRSISFRWSRREGRPSSVARSAAT